MTELVIDPARLDFIHAVTSTHNHTDHLDAETLRPLMQANPGMQLLIPEANRAFVAGRLQCEAGWPVGINDGETAAAGPFDCAAVPAAHETIDRDEEGRATQLGFIIKMGAWTVYHSGDTIPYAGMEDLLGPHGIDLALLPINGRRPERNVAGNLWGREAAQLAHDIGAKMVIPCHYDMFEFNSEPPDEFAASCEQLGQAHRVLKNGERWGSDSPPT